MNLKETVLQTIKTCSAFGKNDEKRNWWKDSYADFGEDIGKVYDWQVADYTKKHMTFFDRLNLRKVAAAMGYSFSILSKSVEEPVLDKKNWKYFRDF